MSYHRSNFYISALYPGKEESERGENLRNRRGIHLHLENRSKDLLHYLQNCSQSFRTIWFCRDPFKRCAHDGAVRRRNPREVVTSPQEDFRSASCFAYAENVTIRRIPLFAATYLDSRDAITTPLPPRRQFLLKPLRTDLVSRPKIGRARDAGAAAERDRGSGSGDHALGASGQSAYKTLGLHIEFHTNLY